MSISKVLVNSFVNITSKAAIAAHKFVGKKNKILADKAAVDIMRSEINKLDIDGKIVIGEGELDEAPMLYIGEKLGSGKGKSIDIAVDPVEGTNFVANNLPGGISVIAFSDRNHLFNAPETYMNKIAINKNIPDDAVDLDNSIKKSQSSLGIAIESNGFDILLIKFFLSMIHCKKGPGLNSILYVKSILNEDMLIYFNLLLFFIE